MFLNLVPFAPKRRWPRFTLRTLFVVVTVFACWLAWSFNWLRERRQAEEWLAAAEHSWYSPSVAGARVEASAPWNLRLLGEHGIVGIGMDVDEFAGPVPYTRAQLERLFPEARVDFSREGNWVNSH